MIVKKYIANTVEEAQEVIRQELGPKAVLLTLRYIQQKGWRALFAANKVEVTAAIEEDDLKAYTGAKLDGVDDGQETSPTLEGNLADLKRVLSKVSDEVDSSSQAAATSSATPVTPTIPTPTVGDGSSRGGMTYGDPRFKGRTSTPAPMSASSGVGQKPASEDLLTLSKVAQQRSESSASSATSLTPEEEQRATRKLEALRRQWPSSPSVSKNKESQDSADEADDVLKVGKGLVDRFGQGASASERPADSSAQSDGVASLERLRRVVREEMERAQGSDAVGGSSADSEAVGSVRFLMNKGVDRTIATQVEERASKRCGRMDTLSSQGKTAKVNALKWELASLINTAGPIRLSPGRPTIATIVGPTGVGKTTTLVKIASQYSQELNKKVAVISLDTSKVGAREQIQGLVANIGCSWTVATNSIELRQAVAAYGRCDLILIDTAGHSQYQERTIESLSEILGTIGDLQIFLAISATTKDLDAYGSIQQFSFLGIDSLIFTKLDETIAHGIMVNVCCKTGKAIRYLTTGQQIPEDLTVADSDDITRALLVQNNSARFDQIRQLATTR